MRNFIDGKSDSQGYARLEELVVDVEQRYRESGSRLVFVDVTSAGMTNLHLDINSRTHYGIVTANKNPLSLSHPAVFHQLTSDPRRYGYSCSVMAGAGAVNFLRDSVLLNDAVTSIDGCLSGTLGFIAYGLQEGRNFSELLKFATDNGYTEPDPRADLSGLDIARKLVVLGRTAGYDIGIEDIECTPFIPSQYFKDEDVSKFISGVFELDDYFAEKVAHAKEKGSVLRSVASLNLNGRMHPIAEVSLKEVNAGDDLGNLKGTANIVVIVSSRGYKSDTPLVIKAPGAGLEVTARNIGRDLLYLPGGIFGSSQL